MQNGKRKNKNVDDAGIRLAPAPIQGSKYHVLPSVRQEFVLEPRIEIDEPEHEEKAEISTERDYQPKKRDVSKRWKREKRAKNVITGLVMFLVTLLILLPYILGVFKVNAEFLPFKYVPSQFDVIGNIINAFTVTAQNGWKGAAVNAVWVNTVPSLILALGMVFVLINLIKSVGGMFLSVKPKKYFACSTIYLLCVVAVFIAALAGAETIGIAKIDFMKDFIYGFRTSEYFTLLVFGAGYAIVSALCTYLNPDKSGY